MQRDSASYLLQRGYKLSHGPFRWHNIATGQSSETYISLYCDIHGYHEAEAINVLGKQLGLIHNNIFPVSIMAEKGNAIKTAKEFLQQQALAARPPLPDDGVLNGRRYRLLHTLPMTASNQNSSGCVWVYDCDGSQLAIPGYYRQILDPSFPYSNPPEMMPRMTIGIGQTHCRLFNENSLQLANNATIILCEDIVQAAKIQAMLKDSASIPKGKYVVTGWFGGEILYGFIKFNVLAGRHVVFIPSARDTDASVLFQRMKNLLGIWEKLPMASLRVSLPNINASGIIVEPSPFYGLHASEHLEDMLKQATEKDDLKSIICKHDLQAADTPEQTLDRLPIWPIAAIMAPPLSHFVPRANINSVDNHHLSPNLGDLFRPGNLTCPRK